MDRFDCQYLMATFVTVYINTFISDTSPQKLLQKVCILLFNLFMVIIMVIHNRISTKNGCGRNATITSVLPHHFSLFSITVLHTDFFPHSMSSPSFAVYFTLECHLMSLPCIRPVNDRDNSLGTRHFGIMNFFDFGMVFLNF